MSLYFQPSPGSVSDSEAAVVTAPETGLDIAELIGRLAARVNNAERKIEHAVSADALARIILTDRDIVLMADQVSIIGQLNIADWIRDISGNIVGGIDTSRLTRVTAGKVQTGILESTNWTTTTGSQINLDNGSITTGGSSAPKFSVDSLGNLTAQSATIQGQLIAGSVITNSVQISGSGTTMQDLVDGIGGTFDLQGALDAGVADILAGVGSNYRLDVDTANAFVAFRHKDAAYKGTAAPGSIKTALGISSSGIAMGYNRASDGAWVDAIALSASGNAVFSGTIAANSIIVNSATVDGVTFGAIKSNAANGDTAYTGTTDFRTTGAPSNQPAIGAVTTTSSSIGTVDIKLTWSYTQGARKAEFFYLYVLEGTTNPTTASPILATVDGSATNLTISGVPMDKSYRVGIVAARKSSLGIEKGAIVNSWVRTGVTGNITANIDGTAPSGVKNTGITLSSNGTLLGAGGGAITALDYVNVSGTKPPPGATENLFTQSASNPSGGVDGNAHWNTATQVMWFRTSGTWKAGGTVNASSITTGTLAAARIASNSITSDKINVTTLSAITANLGSVKAGNISGSANIDIAGTAKFEGVTDRGGSSYAVVVNSSRGADNGLYASDGATPGGSAIFASSSANTAIAVEATNTGPGGAGVQAAATSGTALRVYGTMVTTSSSTVANLRSATSVFADSASTCTTASNSNSLGGYSANSWARVFATPGGTANAAGAGIQFASTISGVSFSGSGNTVTAVPVSDRRRKKNIRPETLGSDFILGLSPVTYENLDESGITYHGFVYQDMAENRSWSGNDALCRKIRMGSENGEEDDVGSTDYIALIAPIVKTLQEFDKRLSALEGPLNKGEPK